MSSKSSQFHCFLSTQYQDYNHSSPSLIGKAELCNNLFLQRHTMYALECVPMYIRVILGPSLPWATTSSPSSELWVTMQWRCLPHSSFKLLCHSFLTFLGTDAYWKWPLLSWAEAGQACRAMKTSAQGGLMIRRLVAQGSRGKWSQQPIGALSHTGVATFILEETHLHLEATTSMISTHSLLQYWQTNSS